MVKVSATCVGKEKANSDKLIACPGQLADFPGLGRS